MKLRIAIICYPDDRTYGPQDEEIIREITVEMRDLPPGWRASRVMICEAEEGEVE